MKPFKVLLVDDEIELVSTLVERLALRGIAADSVTHGDEVMDRLRQKKYDMVVLDILMPESNGLALLSAIKKDFPAMEVILLTGRGSEEELRQGMAEGAFDFLMKPVDIEQLIQVMEKAIKE